MKNIDKAVGNRIKLRRKALDLSQTELAGRIGVKFQQVQKYESGANRVAASRLWQLANALHVHISFFFEGLELTEADQTEQPAPFPPRPTAPETAELVAIFDRLPAAQKHAMGAILRSLDCIEAHDSTA